MGHPDVETEKIDVTMYFTLKHSAKAYYVTIPKELVLLHGLIASSGRKKAIFQGGHRLKVKIIEAKRLKVDQENE